MVARSPERSPATQRWRRRRLHRTRAWLVLAGVRRSTAATVALSIAVALVAGWHTATAVRAAEDAAARYGRTASVLVTRHPVAAGDVLGASDVERRRVPVSLLPDATVARHPSGRVAVADLVAGEVVLEDRLGSSLVPDGWRAIAVTPPGTGAHPPLVAGDVVDIVDVGAEAGSIVARDAVVVSVGREGVVTVAVPAGDLAAAAYAAAGGTAALAVIAPRPRR